MPEQRRHASGCWLAGLVFVGALSGAGVLAWRYIPALRFPKAEAIPIEEYLRLKSVGRIREVWILRDELYAEMQPGCVVNFRPCRYVHASIPAGMRIDAKADDALRSGLSPGRFHEDR